MIPRWLGAAAALLAAAATAADLPQADPPFKGRIAVNGRDAQPDWPAPLHAPAGAPNVVLILLDDVGFGATATFGGAAATPALDRLAAQGLRYNNFNTTALCSPTRAALLTGRNHHQVGFGTLADFPSGFPGYNGQWKRSTATIAQVLRGNGYATAAFGKWHNTPANEAGPTGPFDHWPTGLGFEHFYGFMGGETSEWEPQLYRDTQPVRAPLTPEQGYHLTTDITNEALRWLHVQQSIAQDKPYFLYFAPGAAHAPHHVAQKWVDAYRGKFDAGWDALRAETLARQKRLGLVPQDTVLTPRPAELQDWNRLSADTRKLLARQMEVYAGFLSQTDEEVGRLIDAVQKGPNGDNTLIVYSVGDNGGSAEGGLEGSDENLSTLITGRPQSADSQLGHIDELGSVLHDNHYASAWGWATSAPFQWAKQVASHFGGVRNGLVIAWPARIRDRGGIRTQFAHVTDIAPTIYEATGIAPPDRVDGIDQKPFDGNSLEYSFNDAKAESQHRVQYFEMIGNRAIYADGWVAAARHSLPWDIGGRSEDFTHDRWELYHVAEDFSEAHDVAAQYPDKLRELQALFDSEARRNNVYPLQDGMVSSRGRLADLRARRGSFHYTAELPRLQPLSVPLLVGSHRIVARLQVPQGGASGLIVADGGRYGGYVLYAHDGQLVYDSNFLNRRHDRLVSERPLPAGEVEAVLDFKQSWLLPWPGGTASLYINGEKVGSKWLPHLSFPSLLGSFDVGHAGVSPVSDAYAQSFDFNGHIDSVTIELR